MFYIRDRNDMTKQNEKYLELNFKAFLKHLDLNTFYK